MMKKILLILVLSTIIPDGLMSQNLVVKGHNTQPKSYYLNEQDVPNCLILLPSPPPQGSALFNYDIEQYEWGKTLRNTTRGKLAVDDADLSDTGLAKAFSSAFGIEISNQITPQIFKLITNMKEDCGDLGTRAAKNYYLRPRPFVYFKEDTSIPHVQSWYVNSGSYPSGHTSIGWGVALILSEINTMNQDAILKRGYEIGQSRVIAGFHYQSDVDAARWMSSTIVARLHADKKFNQQMKRAKKEFKRLLKKGRIQKVILTN